MNSIEGAQGMTFEQALSFLAKCQAEYNRLGKIVSTKDPDSLRSACDEEARLRYELSGVKSYDVKLNGMSVGTYSVVKTKEEPEISEVREKRLTIDEENAWRWLLEESPDEVFAAARSYAKTLAVEYMLDTGAIIEGAEINEVVVREAQPAKPSMFKNMVLRIDAKKMDKALESAEPIELGEAE